MSKRNAKTNARPTSSANRAPLKSVHDDIMNANPNATVDTKRMRVWLRTNMNDVHERNAAWTFNASEYDRVRSQFDPAYAASIAKPARVRKPRAAKPAAVTPATADA